MSLRVWLPLNGDLTNNGLSDVVVTNNGATVDNAGKIGKCYNFTSTYIEYDNPLPTICNQFSICAWVNLISGYTANYGLHIASFGTSYGRICVSKDGQAIRVLLNDGTTNYAGGSNALASSLTAGIWNHYAITFDNGVIRIYINGQLDVERTATITYAKLTSTKARIGTYGAENSKGYVNDFRIYDHALSLKEVKLLSQGLVCHYPLNAVGGKAPNLIESTVKSYDPTQYVAYQLSLSENMKANTKYTIQLWDVDVSHTGKSAADLGVDVYWGGGALRMCYWHGTDYFTDGHADYLTATFYVTASTASHANAVNKWLNIYNSVVDASGTRNMSIGKWKLEVGSIATPWTPNVNDDDYSIAVYEDKIIYDSSGYNYNGIPTELSINNNTSRNTVSTMFNGSNSAIKIPLNDMLGLSETADKRDYTISVWTYKTSIGTKSYQTIIGGPANTFELEARNGSSTTPQYVTWSWGKITGSYNFNEWTHVCFVHTSEDSKLYVNGVLQGTGTSANIPIGSFYIGAWKNSTTQNFEGSMSDFRLYATALSSDDIKELYNAPVSVANTGAMLTQGEFVEVAT